MCSAIHQKVQRSSLESYASWIKIIEVEDLTVAWNESETRSFTKKVKRSLKTKLNV
jgi:hypothetical protein